MSYVFYGALLRLSMPCLTGTSLRPWDGQGYCFHLECPSAMAFQIVQPHLGPESSTDHVSVPVEHNHYCELGILCHQLVYIAAP